MNSVLIVDLGAVWGGQEVYSAGLAEALAASGRRVTVLSGHTRHARPGVECIPCDFSYAKFPDTRRRVLDLAARHDLVHYNGIRAIYLSALVGTRTPTVGTKHLGFFSPGKARLQGEVARFATHATFRNLQQLICVSRGIHSELPAGLQRRSVVVRNGVQDLAIGRSAARPDDILSLCFVGRLVPVKGVMRLLAAMKLLHARKVPVKITLAGAGPLEPAAREYVAAHRLSDVVELAGHVEDPAAIYLKSHACVLPSSYEGQPLSLLEALSCGCAAVAHAIPGVDEIIEDGVNGLYAQKDEISLAASLECLAYDRSLLARLMAGARTSYESHWRFERMFAETLAIYGRAAQR